MNIHAGNTESEAPYFSGIHGIDYYFRDIDPRYGTWESIGGFTEEYLDYHTETADGSSLYFPAPILNEFTSGMFGIPFTDFQPAKFRDKRGCSHTYTWRNLINLYFGGRFPNNENSLTVEIKGGYFEFINWDDAKQEQFAAYADSRQGKPKNMHLFIDAWHLGLHFDRMQECMVNHWYHGTGTPKMYTGQTKDAARSIQIGADGSAKILMIYESGRHRRNGDDQFLDYLRLEMKLRDDQAEAAYREWRSGKSIYQLTLDRIAAQIEFIQPYRGKNKCKDRTTTTKWWKEFIESAVPFKLEKPKQDPNAIKKVESRLRNFKKQLQENDPKEVAMQFLQVLGDTTGGAIDLLKQEMEKYFRSLQPI